MIPAHITRDIKDLVSLELQIPALAVIDYFAPEPPIARCTGRVDSLLRCTVAVFLLGAAVVIALQA